MPTLPEQPDQSESAPVRIYLIKDILGSCNLPPTSRAQYWEYVKKGYIEQTAYVGISPAITEPYLLELQRRILTAR